MKLKLTKHLNNSIMIVQLPRAVKIFAALNKDKVCMSVVNVRDLRPGMSRVNVEVTVMKAFQPRTVITRDGRRVTLAEFEVSDNTGSIILTLWGDDINLVKQGDTVRIRNGYVTSFRGEPRLNIGRYGKIEQLTKKSEESSINPRKRKV